MVVPPYAGDGDKAGAGLAQPAGQEELLPHQRGAVPLPRRLRRELREKDEEIAVMRGEAGVLPQSEGPEPPAAPSEAGPVQVVEESDRPAGREPSAGCSRA